MGGCDSKAQSELGNGTPHDAARVRRRATGIRGSTRAAVIDIISPLGSRLVLPKSGEYSSRP